jgi:hypothetical protein
MWLRAHARTQIPQMEPGQHAFVMLGEKTLFLCHLTMLHMPEHMFQVVLRAKLTDDAMAAYLRDRSQHPSETYFLGNSPDDLMTIFSLHSGARREFVADVFRGIPYMPVYEHWPWKNEKPILRGVTLSVEREVYYRRFDLNLGRPETLTYVLFGSGSEAHLTHYQVKEPDFDHILSLAEAPDWLPAEALEAGSHINFPQLPSTPVYCSSPFTRKEYRVQYQGQLGTYSVKIGADYWFSTKITNTGNPCIDVPPRNEPGTP